MHLASAFLTLCTALPIQGDGAEPCSLGEARGYLDAVGQGAVGSISDVVETLQVRTRRTARSAELIQDIEERDVDALTRYASGVVVSSDLVDVVAIFDAEGNLLAFNDQDWEGRPFTPEQREPLLELSFEGREIVMGCVRNKADHEVLEFQTTCDFTPRLFGSTGLSVALTTPVNNARGERIGAVSTRLRFERIRDRVQLGAFEEDGNRIWFVSDHGEYFDEGVNGGTVVPPIPASELGELLTAFDSASQTTLGFERDGRVLSLHAVPGLETLEGGGIRVFIDASASWVAALVSAERLEASLLRRGLIGFLSLSILLGLALACAYRSRRAVAKARETAELASRSKSSFLTSTSHEIRTPMAAILGYAEFLADESRWDDVELRREAVQSIQSNGEHLMTLIGDVLDLAKIEAGSVTLEPTDFSPRALAQQAITLLGPKASAHGTVLTFHAEEAVPQRIQADATRVRQVLLNLLSNAIKFTKGGQVRVELSARFGRLEIAVEDTGIGIEASALERIFDAFEQAECSTTRRFGGTGLGLPISRHLCRLMGGDLEVRSEVGVGSRFAASITFRTASVQIVPESLISAARQDEDEGLLNGSRILVVDDTATNLRLLSLMLSKDGADVTTATNGLEAVDACKAAGTPFDLVLMDAHMPVMGGSEALVELRRLGVPSPVVVLTADALTEARKRYLEEGFDDFATKPIARGDLRSLAARWVRHGSTAATHRAG